MHLEHMQHVVCTLYVLQTYVHLLFPAQRTYRALAYGWFLLLVLGGLFWLQHQKRRTQVTLSQSYGQVETMAIALGHFLNPKAGSETPEAVSKLMSYTTQENSLGRLAKGILQLKTDHQEPVSSAHQD